MKLKGKIRVYFYKEIVYYHYAGCENSFCIYNSETKTKNFNP